MKKIEPGTPIMLKKTSHGVRGKPHGEDKRKRKEGEKMHVETGRAEGW